MSKIEKISEKWAKLDAQEKQVKAEKDELRTELTDLITKEYKKKDFLLPVQSVEVPKQFFVVTKVTHRDFLDSRYPGWDLTKTMEDDHKIIFILRKQPALMSRIIELDDAQLTKIIAEYTPEVDWETLEKEDPDLYNRISQKVETTEINEAALERESQENPEVFSILRRHMRVRTPSVKFLLKRKKADGSE